MNVAGGAGHPLHVGSHGLLSSRWEPLKHAALLDYSGQVLLRFRAALTSANADCRVTRSELAKSRFARGYLALQDR